VEQDGEYLRILGRASEVINVGGEKVHPAEVESVIQCMDGVEDVAVRGEPHPITGQVVVARVKLSTGETRGDFARRMRTFCAGRLGAARTPQKVEVSDRPSFEDRFKRMRGR
jgi:acyl-coenzyme A synthetase/AMP-(fatty) acid ligase